MKLHELAPAPGARKERRRVGRGLGSGLGKTAGKGHKGQNARSGGGVRLGFEGGQTPIQRQLPKRGFKNISRKEYAVINLDHLCQLTAGDLVTPESLKKSGIIKDMKDGLKILGNGELDRVMTVRAHKFSQAALEKIAAAGGKAEVI